jgi:hypothetical protein
LNTYNDNNKEIEMAVRLVRIPEGLRNDGVNSNPQSYNDYIASRGSSTAAMQGDFRKPDRLVRKSDGSLVRKRSVYSINSQADRLASQTSNPRRRQRIRSIQRRYVRNAEKAYIRKGMAADKADIYSDYGRVGVPIAGTPVSGYDAKSASKGSITG